MSELEVNQGILERHKLAATTSQVVKGYLLTQAINLVKLIPHRKPSYIIDFREDTGYLSTKVLKKIDRSRSN